MIITGSNVDAQTKDATISHSTSRFSIDLLTTKRGIAIDIRLGKIIKNGDTFLIVDNKQEIYEFEKELNSITEMQLHGEDRR